MPDRPRVGYLGPEGTFSEEALLASASVGAVEPVPSPTIYDAFLGLTRGELEWAVVPIENSLDGSLSVTLDLLGAEAGGPEIVGEILLSVKHSLITCGPVELAEIETVLTHPQVPGQCQRLLRGELAHATVLAASSTAEAVRTIAQQKLRTQAALGTLLAAEVYQATVLREDVQDRGDNETRFVWLAPRPPEGGDGDTPAGPNGPSGPGGASGPNGPNVDGWSDGRTPPLRQTASGEWKTSLVFWGAGANSPGWLVRCLDEFGRRAINLTKIESRPKRERMGSYMFFVDLHGRASDPAIAAALAGLAEICEHVRVLGSYPRAAPAG